MTPEPRNYFYDLLIPASVLFVVTVLAYALVPPDRQPDWLYAHGWKLLLGEVGLIVVLGLLSMGYDRWLTVRRQPPALPRREADSPQGG